MRLFIIGNGVDIGHGLKTKYIDYAKSNYFNRELENYINIDYINEWFDLEEALKAVDYEDVLDNSSGAGFNDYGADDWSDADHHRHMQEFEIFEEIVPNFRRYLNEEVLPNIISRRFTTCEDAIFITFNYTPLLERIYSIKSKQVSYIHGSLLNEKSNIILGHNGENKKSNNEKIEEALIGVIDEIEKNQIINECYEDPRHSELNGAYCYWYNSLKKDYNKNFKKVKMELPISECNKINVLGHSYNEIDLEYFKLIRDYTLNDIVWNLYYHSDEDLKRLEVYIQKLNLKNYNKIELEDVKTEMEKLLIQ